MRGRAPWGRRATGLLVLGALTACSPDGPDPDRTAAVDAAAEAAHDAAEAAGTASTGAVGGDVQDPGGASFELPRSATVRAFAVGTGGGSVVLDLAGTPIDLDCDGTAHPVDPLVLPDEDDPVFAPTRVSDAPGSWAVGFAER